MFTISHTIISAFIAIIGGAVYAVMGVFSSATDAETDNSTGVPTLFSIKESSEEEFVDFTKMTDVVLSSEPVFGAEGANSEVPHGWNVTLSGTLTAVSAENIALITSLNTKKIIAKVTYEDGDSRTSPVMRVHAMQDRGKGTDKDTRATIKFSGKIFKAGSTDPVTTAKAGS